ncbi:hypothetical protein [Rubinisphaera italica]|uniref:Uncharacterized protein n=1 Tax=Rubinisphaera italica TaxID=2527969 RepID=A0A5C5XDB4_9PLAN|nr:hypothetical protein [Rubinisphaera italica]TWT60764.1 hypothetical protein Pan54_14910 [Rubinisphaera italica]
MPRKRRRNKRGKKKNLRKTSRSKKPQEQSVSSVSWYWYAVVIVLALILFAVFIVTQFDPIDRMTMLGVSVVSAGIAFLIIGTCSAVGNFDFDEASWIEKSLGYLALMATPRRRIGELFYSRAALYVFFEKILIALVFPLGFILAFLRPKQTWPAILWVGGGLLAILGTYFGALVINSMSY